MTFRIRCYGRTELAQMYFPHANADTAWRRLKSWIVRCKPLRDDLAALGYARSRRSFTAAEVRAIIYRLGEP